MPRILLFGAGGIGTAYIYLFSKGGAQVTAICRSNYDAAKARGFTINSTLWGDVHVQPEVVRTPSDASGPWDFVVVCSKAMPGTKPSTAETIGPGCWSQYCHCHHSEWYRGRRGVCRTIPANHHLV